MYMTMWVTFVVQLRPPKISVNLMERMDNVLFVCPGPVGRLYSLDGGN